MNFRPRRRDYPELNLIPMIDVLIVLLIFLVLTTTFSREAELQIHLPEATGQSPGEEKGIDVVIDADGRYFVDKHLLVNTQPETIQKALREAAGDKKDPLVVVSADQMTPHQSVMRVLDAAGQLGFFHLTFAAKTEPGAEPPADRRSTGAPAQPPPAAPKSP